MDSNCQLSNDQIRLPMEKQSERGDIRPQIQKACYSKAITSFLQNWK